MHLCCASHRTIVSNKAALTSHFKKTRRMMEARLCPTLSIIHVRRPLHMLLALCVCASRQRSVCVFAAIQLTPGSEHSCVRANRLFACTFTRRRPRHTRSQLCCFPCRVSARQEGVKASRQVAWHAAFTSWPIRTCRNSTRTVLARESNCSPCRSLNRLLYPEVQNPGKTKHRLAHCCCFVHQ